MDFQKDHREDCDDQERVQPLQFPGLIQPRDQLRHAPRRVEGRSRLEHDPDHLPSFIECADIVGCCLVLAPVTLILLAVAQQVAM